MYGKYTVLMITVAILLLWVLELLRLMEEVEFEEYREECTFATLSKIRKLSMYLALHIFLYMHNYMCENTWY